MFNASGDVEGGVNIGAAELPLTAVIGLELELELELGAGLTDCDEGAEEEEDELDESAISNTAS